MPYKKRNNYEYKTRLKVFLSLTYRWVCIKDIRSLKHGPKQSKSTEKKRFIQAFANF